MQHAIPVDDLVQEAVNALRLEGIDAAGITAHVAKKDDRKKLIDFAIERWVSFVELCDLLFLNVLT